MSSVAKHILQGFGDDHAFAVHPNGVSLQYGNPVIHVDNQAGAAIAFAVYQPIAVGFFLVDNGLPDVANAGEFFGPVRSRPALRVRPAWIRPAWIRPL